MPRRSVQEVAEEFEGDIRKFLREIGFKNVGGGRRFKLAGEQIDACGGYDNTFVVIDCHIAQQLRQKSVRQKIKEIRGIKRNIRKDLKKKRRYKKYPRVKFILCTKNIQISEQDLRYASKAPKIWVLTERAVDYYRKLVKKIGDYAIYELLGELEVIPPKDKIPIPTLKTKLRGKPIYIFLVKPERLLKIAYVARREKGKEGYYQRILKRERVREIGEDFLSKRKGIFANSVIINFRKKQKFIPRRFKGLPSGTRFGFLRLPSKYRSAWIIDGQHRLYGFCKAKRAKKELSLPIVAFEELRESEQAEFFLTINKEQKPVDPNLLWDISGEIHPTTEIGIISNIVKELNRSGPFNGRIYIPSEGASKVFWIEEEGRRKKKRKHIYLANFCDGIQGRKLISKRMINMPERYRNPLFAHRVKNKKRRAAIVKERVVNILNSYFSIVAEQFNSDWAKEENSFFFTNNGINVALRILESISVYSKIHLRRVPTEDDMRGLLQPLSINYAAGYQAQELVDSLRRSCSSEGGREFVAGNFRSVIGESNPNFARIIGLPSARDEVVDFERKLRNFVREKMAALSPQWWRQRVSQGIRSRAEEEMRRQGSNDPSEFLTLGQCKEVIVGRNDNWDQVFEAYFGPKFRTKERFKVKFEEFTEFCNRIRHGRGPPLNPRERDLLRIYFADLEECI